MSGSSQRACGGPEREQNARSYPRSSRPKTRRASGLGSGAGLGSGRRRNDRREGEGRGPFFHAQGDGVGDENQSNPSGISPALNQSRPCAPDRAHFSTGHAGHRIVGAYFIHNDLGVWVVRTVLCAKEDTPPLFTEGTRGLGKVFAVLTAPRIRGIGGCWQHEDASRAGLGEFVQPSETKGCQLRFPQPTGMSYPRRESSADKSAIRR